MRLSTQGYENPEPATEAWRQYAAGSEVDHFAIFCREHLIQSEDRWEGKPLVLELWQRRMLGEALASALTAGRRLTQRSCPCMRVRIVVPS